MAGLTDDKLSEAEKLAKMTKGGESTVILSQKQERALAAREVDITRRELMAEAKNTLAERSFLWALQKCLITRMRESCN